MIVSALASTLLLASAQRAPAAPVPGPGLGLEPSAVRQWLVDHGGQATPLSTNGDPAFVLADRGLTWVVAFPGCRSTRCGDLQIGATAERADLTLEAVNAWNREHRFAKAFFVPADATRPTPSATLQLDVVIDPAKGPEQLGDAVNLWIQLVGQFAQANGVATPDPAR